MIELKCQTMFVNAELTLGIKKMLLFGAKNKFQTPNSIEKILCHKALTRMRTIPLHFITFSFLNVTTMSTGV
jgi:hypothetical protein